MLSVRCNRDYVLCILNWCIKKWGKSEFVNTLPNLTVYKSKGSTRNIKGEYVSEKNRIVIYLGDIDTYEELCGIVIHEYTHYMLDNYEYDEIYYKFLDSGKSEKYIYKMHPHEIKCRENQKEFSEICFQEVKKHLK